MPTAAAAAVSSAELPCHLEGWTPQRCAAAPASPADAREHVHRLATRHYENFPVASVVLPADLRPHFHAVYAFCRWADDLGDEVPGADASLALLDWWRGETTAMFAGEPPRHPVFVALKPTAQRFALTPEPFLDLISAFEQDQTVTHYETFADLHDYCRRSADPVGRIVLKLLSAHTPEHVALSDSVCTGLQLINFWQDVARDADIGRRYLPTEDLARFGYSLDDYAARRTTPAFLDLMRFEVDRAAELLAAGRPLADRLGGRFGIAIDLFASGGLAICGKVRRLDYRVWDLRPKLGKRDAAGLLAGAMGRGLRRTVLR
ncbi:squalene synthase HpnC [Alienimonas californiensis]|uniref:All-trans-phytoene synthase n=1 Tax=Alienimonas californiensis TaxID=2527989 RepID=A0A517PEP6_9PLAN|nr:squalene synthase HpnC [Alienimonas californiensis]QDT17836.1 All-trans-phytoene synthase [Alienimonas californiensis]